MNDLGNWLTDHPWVGWVGLAVVLSVIELLSLDLVLLMFAFGALAAAVVASLGAPLWACILAFVIISLAMLAIVRPAMARRLHAGPELTTGYEAIGGKIAVVEETVGPHGGRVTLGGEAWSAHTELASESFEPSTEVMVVRIDGASLIVTRKADRP